MNNVYLAIYLTEFFQIESYKSKECIEFAEDYL